LNSLNKPVRQKFLFFITKGPKAESITYVFAQSSFDLTDLP
jgi:hypothetical protein